MHRLPLVFFKDDDGKEIDLAVRRKAAFESDPEGHTYVWQED
jgi:hypothetical protein